MSFFNKKRTDSTYLKYKNGKIHSTGDDIEFNEKNDSVDTKNQDYKEPTNNEELIKKKNSKTGKNTKSKIFLITGFCIMLIPFMVLGFKYLNESMGNMSDFMSESDTGINNEEEKPKETEIIVKSDKDDPETAQDVSFNSILSKINPETVVSYSNKVNTSMTKYYSFIKSDLLLFYNTKESSYTTGKNLEAIRVLINKDYQYILSKESIFEKENQKDLYIVTKNRYINILNTVDSITVNVSRVDCIPNFNNGLSADNQLCEKQQELMNSYLKNKNITFEITENIINIK